MSLRLRTAFLLASLGGLALLWLGVSASTDGYRRVARIVELQQVSSAITGSGLSLALLVQAQDTHAPDDHPRAQWRTQREQLRRTLEANQERLRPFQRELARIEQQLEELERQWLADRPPAPGSETRKSAAMQQERRIDDLRAALDALEAAIHRSIESELGVSD